SHFIWQTIRMLLQRLQKAILSQARIIMSFMDAVKIDQKTNLDNLRLQQNKFRNWKAAKPLVDQSLPSGPLTPTSDQTKRVSKHM
ncbi:MAG: hypothetical protein VXZ53_06225, partial [Planctomycetota bacterium]|nr:hypothetical protein [Planctomycetota bacterium]